jgi:hypothetical protein
MDLSIFLFRFFGFYFFLVGGAFMIRSSDLRLSLNEFVQNKGLLLFSAIINLLLGLFLVLNYNEWEFTAKGFITAIGWLILIKGIIRLYFPNSGIAFARKMMAGSTPLLIGGIQFLIGVWLLHEGFSN